MKIAISGASGFVGTHLSRRFGEKGYEVVPLGKDFFKDGAKENLKNSLEGCDAVINLAGAPINHRWSKSYKRLMYESRIGVTRRLVDAINSLDVKPKLLISTSAVGYYPSEGCYDEYNSVAGDGFLSKLCGEWEKEAQRVSPEVRLVNTRFAVILSPEGGAFPRMAKPARLGMATIIGSGRQPFPWIALQDHSRAIEYIMEHSEISGIVNLIAPHQINNREFTTALAAHYRSLATVRIPGFVFRLFMGESSEFITQGQCVEPSKLKRHGFEYECGTIEKFFSEI